MSNLVHVETLVNKEDRTQVQIDGKWVEARPLSYPSLVWRVQLAWGVLTGKYDALKWEGQ